MTQNPQIAHSRYPAYRDSGVEWIGEIPSHWEVVRLSALGSFSKGGGYSKSDLTVDGLPAILYGDIYTRYGITLEEPSRKIPQEVALKARKVKKGDLLFAGSGETIEDIGKCTAYLSSEPAFAGGDIIIQSVEKGSSHFISYVMNSWGAKGELAKTAKGEIIVHTYASKLKAVKIPVPPLPEQIAIARFLDEKTAQLDRAIGQKQRLIALLQERRQVLIQQAVTRGLDPSVPMRDSGVDWIGEVPGHWGVRRSKFLFTQRKERARKDDVQLSATQAYGVIPHADYEEKIGRKISIAQLHLDKRKHVEVDDFVISMRSFQGGLERAWTTGCIRSSYVILRPLEDIDPGFYSFLFKSQRYIEALQSSASFIRDGQDLNFDNFAQIDLYIPPIEEQRRISAYLTEQLSKTQEVIDLQQRHIEQLREYRSVLIHEVVTGKIRVK